MRLISVAQARSLWLFSTNDLNPKGRNLTKELLPGLIARYNFLTFPKKPEELNMQTGIKFEDGSFGVSPDAKITVHFNAYTVGLLAITRSSTEETDIFLEDLLGWLADDFNLVPYRKLNIRRMYTSEVYVESKEPLTGLNPRLSDFAQKISQSTGEYTNKAFQFSGISFTGDPSAPGQKQNFILERDIAAPFSENRYFSSAPLHTSEHLSLLDELETILA